jgi:hypothetical protein
MAANDHELMQQIRERWASRISQLEPAYQPFMAALVANESGGDPDAKRFEPAVFRHLAHLHPDWTAAKLTDNAHSWGLTQIMGYHTSGSPQELCNPDTALSMTLGMLQGFRQAFHLDAADWEGLFRCWNTGHPKGTTYDPAYVQNGLVRMQLWLKLPIAE